MKISTYVEKIFNVGTQYYRPAGIRGRIAGNLMVQQHEPENRWTVSLLNAEPTDHILEIGFGPGFSIQQLSALVTGGHIAGIDYSQTMVRAASRRNARAIKAGHVDLRYGEAAHLPFEDASFDKVYSIHTLYFWLWSNAAEELYFSRVLTEVHRVLKTDGIFCLTFMPREQWPLGREGVPSTDTVVQWMTQAGFTNTHIDMGPEKKTFREIAVIGVKSSEDLQR